MAMPGTEGANTMGPSIDVPVGQFCGGTTESILRRVAVDHCANQIDQVPWLEHKTDRRFGFVPYRDMPPCGDTTVRLGFYYEIQQRDGLEARVHTYLQSIFSQAEAERISVRFRKSGGDSSRGRLSLVVQGDGEGDAFELASRIAADDEGAMMNKTGLIPADCAYIDNAIFKTPVQETEPSSECKKRCAASVYELMRVRFGESAAKTVDVKLVKTMKLTPEDKKRLVERGVVDAGEIDGVVWQKLKVATPDVPRPRDLLRLIRDGAFRDVSLFSVDVDLTCEVFGMACPLAIAACVERKYGQGFCKNVVARGTRVLPVDQRQGAKCMTVAHPAVTKNQRRVTMECLGGKPCVEHVSNQEDVWIRAKAYGVLACMISQAAVQDEVGCNIRHWMTKGGRRGRTVLATRKSGVMKFELSQGLDTKVPENGVVAERVDFWTAHERAWEYDDLELYLVDMWREIRDVDVFNCSHYDSVRSWVARCFHTLVVYDPAADIGLVCWAVNQQTRRISGVLVNGWASKSSYAMKYLAFGGYRPIDVIAVQMGAGTAGMQRPVQVPPDDVNAMLGSPPGKAFPYFQSVRDQGVVGGAEGGAEGEAEGEVEGGAEGAESDAVSGAERAGAPSSKPPPPPSSSGMKAGLCHILEPVDDSVPEHTVRLQAARFHRFGTETGVLPVTRFPRRDAFYGVDKIDSADLVDRVVASGFWKSGEERHNHDVHADVGAPLATGATKRLGNSLAAEACALFDFEKCETTLPLSAESITGTTEWARVRAWSDEGRATAYGLYSSKMTTLVTEARHQMLYENIKLAAAKRAALQTSFDEKANDVPSYHRLSGKNSDLVPLAQLETGVYRIEAFRLLGNGQIILHLCSQKSAHYVVQPTPEVREAIYDKRAEFPAQYLDGWRATSSSKPLGTLTIYTNRGGVLDLSLEFLNQTLINAFANEESGWRAPSRAQYQNVDMLGRGHPANIDTVWIDSVKACKDKQGADRVVFKDTEGRVWRYRRHDLGYTKDIILRPGYGIDVKRWRAIEPPRGDTSGPSPGQDASPVAKRPRTADFEHAQAVGGAGGGGAEL